MGEPTFLVENWDEGLLEAEIDPGEVQLIITSPTVPEHESLPLDREPVDLNLHISREADFMDQAKYWLDHTGSLIYHHDLLPINAAMYCPSEWSNDLYLHQLLVWDKGYVSAVRPDWFNRKVELIWWFVSSPVFYLNKRRKHNYFKGAWIELEMEMILSLTEVGDIVVGDLPAQQVCKEYNRKWIRG